MFKNTTIRFSIGESAANPQNPRATTDPEAKKATVERFVEALTTMIRLAG